MVSVVMPAGIEKYLQRTIDEILEKAEGDVEVIVHLDGVWPDPPINDDPRVILIHSGKQRGMRAGINSCAAIARGKYLMKLDAHCALDKGFDTKLKADCERDWLVVPQRYSLKEDTWKPDRPRAVQQYIRPPYKKPERARWWDAGMGGKDWRGYKPESDLFDLMSFQGSCYFMHLDYFRELGGLDDSVWGIFTKEAQEIGVKVWLSGGRCVRNMRTWYAHWHKGKDNHRGYFLNRDELQRGELGNVDMWMNNKWPKQKHDFKWLIDKFSPVPEWENFNWETKCLT